MKWTDERGGNVEDRRGMGGGGMMVGGGLGTPIIAAIIFFLGGDPLPYSIPEALQLLYVRSNASHPVNRINNSTNW